MVAILSATSFLLRSAQKPTNILQVQTGATEVESAKRANADKRELTSIEDRKKRRFILDGKVQEDSMRKICERIIEINADDESRKERDSSYVPLPIEIIVNTYGGSLYDAFMLVGVMDTSDTPIHTYCHGKAMSAGFLIFSAGHKRFATEQATFMYHNASVGMHNDLQNLQEDLDHYKRLMGRYDDYIVKVTNIERSFLDDVKSSKDTKYMTALEAHEVGLVDEMLYRKQDK